MSSKKKDYLLNIAVGVFLLVLSVFVYSKTLKLPASPYEPLGAAFLPKSLAILIGLLSLGITIQYLIKLQAVLKEDAEDQEEKPSYQPHPWLGVVGLILTAVYIAVMSSGLVGFKPATFVFVMILGNVLFRYEKKLGKISHHLLLTAISLLLSFGLFYVFTNIIYTNLP